MCVCVRERCYKEGFRVCVCDAIRKGFVCVCMRERDAIRKGFMYVCMCVRCYKAGFHVCV